METPVEQTKEQRILAAIFEIGPSISLIASYAEIYMPETKRIISGHPDLRRAYNVRVEDILDTIRKFGANQTILAQIYQVDRNIVNAWLSDDKRLQAAHQDYYESIVDIAESNLLMALQRQEPWATLHVLRSRGAVRGWAEKISINLEEDAKRYGINLNAIVDTEARRLADKTIDVEAEEV